MMKKYNFDELIPREGTDCVKYDLRKMFFKKEDVIPLWVADMDFRTPDFILDAIRKRLEHPILGYSVRGEGFYQAIIGWLKERHNWEIEKEWICYSPGIVPALNLLVLSMSMPGDSVVVQPPVYFPFFTAVSEHDRKLEENPLVLESGRLQLDFGQLDHALKGAKLLLLCSPHNPGGSVWTENELKQIADLCEKHHVIVISDEIHSDLVFGEKQHIPFSSVSEYARANTITCMAPSKTFNLAGMSTSYLIIQNEELRAKYNEILNEKMHIGFGNVLGSVALEAAYEHGAGWLDQLLLYLQGNIDFVDSFLKEHIPSVTAIIPEATYMLWLDCSGMQLDDEDLNKFFIEKAGLGLNHGPMFGTGGKGFQRMNIACPREIVVDALNNLKTAIEQD